MVHTSCLSNSHMSGILYWIRAACMLSQKSKHRVFSPLTYLSATPAPRFLEHRKYTSSLYPPPHHLPINHNQGTQFSGRTPATKRLPPAVSLAQTTCIPDGNIDLGDPTLCTSRAGLGAASAMGITTHSIFSWEEASISFFFRCAYFLVVFGGEERREGKDVCYIFGWGGCIL
jgi:hypothetical protein